MTNISKIERIGRIVFGLLIFSSFFMLKGNARYVGLIGLIPIITGSIGSCPMYAVLGINTNKNSR